MKTETVGEQIPEMTTQTLVDAGVKAEKQKAEKRERTVKGVHLQEPMLARVKSAGLTAEEKSGFFKVEGIAKGKRVYIAKKGGRVDLSGFTLASSSVKQITDAEAKEKHLGKVRGQLDFDQKDEDILGAFDEALVVLNTKDPEPEPKAAPVAPATEPAAQ